MSIAFITMHTLLDIIIFLRYISVNSRKIVKTINLTCFYLAFKEPCYFGCFISFTYSERLLANYLHSVWRWYVAYFSGIAWCVISQCFNVDKQLFIQSICLLSAVIKSKFEVLLFSLSIMNDNAFFMVISCIEWTNCYQAGLLS